MSRLHKMQEKRKQLNRFQSLKSIFSSLFMTAAAVVVAVVVIPKSPQAEISKIDAYTNQIVYTVNVTDEDSAIIPGTLKIQLENQYISYEKEIDIGVTTGIFNDLEEDTKYTLRILADKGYGTELLDSVKISTVAKTGGAITGNQLLSGDDDELLLYQIDYFISDPFSEFSSYELLYAFVYSGEEDNFTYTTIVLSDPNASLQLPEIYNSNYEVRLILQAYDSDSQVIELDQLSFHTPYQIWASIDPNHVSDSFAELSVYAEMMTDLELEYEVVLECGGFIVDRQKVIVPESSGLDQFHEFGGMTVEFDNLYRGTNYIALLYAHYHDPYTEAYTEKLISSVEFTTMERLSYQYSIEEFASYYEITVQVDDPNDMIDTAYYEVYDISEGFLWYQSGMTYQLETIDGVKQIVITIDKPVGIDYQINFGIRSSSTYYYNIILDILDNLQEE